MLVLIAGCSGDKLELPAIIIKQCPAMKDYTAEEQKKLQAELATDGPVTKQFLADYDTHLRKCRAYEKTGTK